MALTFLVAPSIEAASPGVTVAALKAALKSMPLVVLPLPEPVVVLLFWGMNVRSGAELELPVEELLLVTIGSPAEVLTPKLPFQVPNTLMNRMPNQPD